MAPANRLKAHQALVTRLPSRMQRTLAAKLTAAAAVVAPVPVDDRFVAIVFSTCAPASGLGKVQFFAAPIEDREPFTLNYALTNGDDVNVTGSMVLDPHSGEAGVGEVTVPNLTRGSYRVNFFDSGNSEPVVSQPIDVLACVTAELSCQGIAFSNPGVNPAVEVSYFDTEEEDGEWDSVLVQPGETSAVRTNLTYLTWFASLPFPDDGEDGEEPDDGPLPLVFASAGEADVTIDQDCGIEVTTTATVGCSTAGAAARIELHVAHPADLGIRYQILNLAGDVLVAKELAAVGKAYDNVSATVPAAGEYQYALYLGGDPNAFERIRFAALTCVTTEVRCETASFANPSGNPAVTVRFGADPGGLGNQLEVASGRTAQTAWHQPSLAWNAYRTAAGPFIESAGGLSAQQLTVPQHCSGVGSGTATGSNGTGSGDLAATGPTGATPLGLLAGVLLTLAGALVIKRRRRLG